MTNTRTALVLIDFQAWIVRELAPRGGRAAANAAAVAMRQARSDGHPVIHVQYLRLDGTDGGSGSPETRFVDGIAALPAEPLITKYGRSAFQDTELHTVLEEGRIRRVTLAGVVTEGGIEATARSALDLGYDVCVLSDAVAGHTPAGHADAINRLARIGVDIHGRQG